MLILVKFWSFMGFYFLGSGVSDSESVVVASPAGKLNPTSVTSNLLDSFLGGCSASSLALALALTHLGILGRLLVMFLSVRLLLFLVFEATGDGSLMRSKADDSGRFPSLSLSDNVSWADVLSVFIFPILRFKGARLDFSSGSNLPLPCGVRWATFRFRFLSPPALTPSRFFTGVFL